MMDRNSAFPETRLGKNGPSGVAMAQFIEFRCQVSGFGCQGTEVLNPDTSYETSPKWHGLLMIKLAAYQANCGTRIKLRLAGTANRLNIERPTSNVEY